MDEPSAESGYEEAIHTPWDELPDDLVFEILRDAEPGVLAVARLACRSWRRGRAETVEELKGVPACSLAAALRAFPRATTVAIDLGKAGTAQPPRRKLSSLHGTLMEARQAIPRLRSLRLTGPSSASASGLSLAAEQLPAGAFDSLEQLQLHGITTSAACLEKLGRHLPQLRRLVIDRRWDGHSAWRRMFFYTQRLPFTQLRELELLGEFVIEQEQQFFFVPVLSPSLERLTICGFASATHFHVAPIPTLKASSLELQGCESLQSINLSHMTSLTRLVLNDLASLSVLLVTDDNAEGMGGGGLLAALSRLTSLRELAFTGRQRYEYLPRGVLVLTQLTRLELGLHSGACEGGAALLTGPWDIGRRPSPIAGCVSLRELVLHDGGEELKICALAGLSRLTALTSLDLGGVANPVLLGDWALRMPALRRLVVPPGVPGLEERRRAQAAAELRAARARTAFVHCCRAACACIALPVAAVLLRTLRCRCAAFLAGR
ncbi:hypothetical protein Rsub_05338 [Raphidocelis subcapitata]|uniref:F-box domain-containing protein n=1 Tax=Raphidocelis subcapitata TaxID=307507 RepID=A0A2V0P595_9CHLO|nr:hypothetical protein Rsub_05338 [Raphidocelis subcapitata]|eukprot:GBF92255.1 hypothetical protein Rsub_05338 [Raphidocelis subcapitata]